MPSTLTEEQGQQLLRTCRTLVGDELRNVTYFTDDEVEKLYLRDDLDWSQDLVGYVENERQGFRSQTVYDDSDLGEYRGTVRMFEGGFITRVIEGDHGVFVTTDPMTIDRFEELASALREALEETA